MKNYDVYIQENFVATIEANNTGEALKIVSEKIVNNEFTVDPNKPQNIKIKPKND